MMWASGPPIVRKQIVPPFNPTIISFHIGAEAINSKLTPIKLFTSPSDPPLKIVRNHLQNENTRISFPLSKEIINIDVCFQLAPGTNKPSILSELADKTISSHQKETQRLLGENYDFHL